MNTQLLVKKYLDRTVPGVPAFQDFFALPFQTYNNFSAYISHVFIPAFQDFFALPFQTYNNFSAYISHVFSRTQLSLLK